MKLYEGDCLEIMKTLETGSVDMILCDLPYGTTSCLWDSILPFDMLWVEYWRLIKPNGAVVLTSSQPFTSALIMSQPKAFRYCWVWDKVKPSTGLHAKIMPLRVTEDICVFSKEKILYRPQMKLAKHRKEEKLDSNGEAFGGKRVARYHDNKGLSYPKNLISISNANQKNRVHPTQKPVELMEYLIKTYTDEGETVLDNTMGSGSTGVACKNTGREFIGIERDHGYFSIAKKRIEEHMPNLC